MWLIVYLSLTLVDDPPVEVPASTPALVAQNEVPNDDDDDDEPLNENDDDELDDLDQGEDQNTHHLVLAQFDKVTYSALPLLVNYMSTAIVI